MEKEYQIICRVRDYVEYADGKIAVDEIPLDYSAWQQVNAPNPSKE